MSEVLLNIDNLGIKVAQQDLVKGVSFTLEAGQTLGIVGESGSGKSLTSLAVMGLLPQNLKASGTIRFQGKDLLKLKEERLIEIRGREIAMIFQEPMSALNPSTKCGSQVAEILRVHTPLKRKAVKAEVLRLFEEVELPRPKSIYNSYPHQLSGGQKQRVLIAMAVACTPKLLIADEPTTALDVSVQAGILRLLKRLQVEYGMALLFISHDLRIVKQVADSILVMHLGEVKEYAAAEKLFKSPEHPYTRGLLACRPTAETYDRRLPLVRDFLASETTAKDILSPRVKEERARLLLKQHPLFEISDVSKIFKSNAGLFSKPAQVHALEKVSVKVYPGESLGLVGESGSGKTTLGRILVGLEKCSEGAVFYQDKDIAKADARSWRQLHRKIQIIFQDPFSSLNPRLKIGEAIAEVLRQQRLFSPLKARHEAENLLEKVGLLKDYYSRYPHEFSGGQRQRIGIARALAVQPDFIVCDESVSALDVSVQAQILNLLNDLKEEFNFTYLFISHDLNVVKYFCDRMVVLQNGKVVEEGLSEEVYRQPRQEYTQKLIAAAAD